ncbi:hypothetical protein [Chitinasiproducens palmae]|uniref:Uncharacterized protein n=1 Tax=Chitinasiproducens palmae TaxID=1770053 RepID=A0A1H2PMF7_9BURK|nr:hypothetical protein [Chitinasiproducens palmae]SDV46912.1 hypothetical protein SAMN05216551_10296 [Chitinasiproducens palmae]
MTAARPDPPWRGHPPQLPAREGASDAALRGPRCVAQRIDIDVCLDGATLDIARSRLAALLHSPLGVYVAQTALRARRLCVRIEVASRDIDFAIHTLVATLPAATIGAVSSHDARD